MLDEVKTADGCGHDSETRVRVQDVKIGVKTVSKNGEEARTDEKDGNIQVTCVKPKAEDVRSDLKDEIARVTEIAVGKTDGGASSDFRRVNDVGLDQKELGETAQKEKPEGKSFTIQKLNETLLI